MIQLAPADYAAIGLSLKIAITAVVISLPFGFAVAYLSTFARFRGKLLLEAMVNLPLTLPPVVIGYLLLLLLGRNGWLGSLLGKVGIRIIFTWKAAVVACAVVGFPLLVRAIRIGMESIDIRLIQASRTLGAPWHDTLFSVILPLSRLGEFGATIIVAGNIPGVTRTIPLAIYDYTASPGGEPMAAALCIVSVTISVVILLFHERLNGKSREGT